jgi:hypothetical protein
MIFAASFFALFGCAITGKTVPVEDRIKLVSDGNQKGEQAVDSVKITYTYRLYKKKPDLSGTLEIGGNAEWEHGVAYSLKVWINILDSVDRILETESPCEITGFTAGDFRKNWRPRPEKQVFHLERMRGVVTPHPLA